MKLYDVVLQSILPGREQTVRDGLVQVFRVDLSAVEGLLASLPHTVKSKVEGSVATRFRDALSSIGAEVEIREHRRGETIADGMMPTIAPPPMPPMSHAPGPRWFEAEEDDPFADSVPLELAADPRERTSSSARGFARDTLSTGRPPASSSLPDPVRISPLPTVDADDATKVADLWLMNAPRQSEDAARTLARVVGMSIEVAHHLVQTVPCLLITRGSYQQLAVLITELRAQGFDVKPRRSGTVQSLRPPSLPPPSGEGSEEVSGLALLRKLLKRP